jgi:hypothetical protein
MEASFRAVSSAQNSGFVAAGNVSWRGRRRNKGSLVPAVLAGGDVPQRLTPLRRHARQRSQLCADGVNLSAAGTLTVPSS